MLSLSVFFKDYLFFFFGGGGGVSDTEMITSDQSIHLSKGDVTIRHKLNHAF